MCGEPIRVSVELALAIHQRQLAEHGGSNGIRDQALLESALARPRQLLAYGRAGVDPPAPAASYVSGIARNHPFVDGNRRIAAVLCELFLELNGHLLLASDVELYPQFIGPADGSIDEAAFAEWLREHSRPEQVSEPAGGYRPR